jgi:hypothetical protein
MKTFTDLVTTLQNTDYRINSRTRDLNCQVGFERTEEEIAEARQEVLDLCINQAGSWAIMFNEPQFEF